MPDEVYRDGCEDALRTFFTFWNVLERSWTIMRRENHDLALLPPGMARRAEGPTASVKVRPTPGTPQKSESSSSRLDSGL